VRLMMDIQDAVSATSSSSISSTAEHPSGSTVLRGGQSHAPRPFMLSLPPIGTVRSLYNFPNEYMPIIQQGRTVRASIDNARFESSKSHHDMMLCVWEGVCLGGGEGVLLSQNPGGSCLAKTWIHEVLILLPIIQQGQTVSVDAMPVV
jgi:hypothetical protein